jgi:DNA-binding NtrC family response regulator
MKYEPIDSRLGRIIEELIANGITLEQGAESFERKYVATAMERCRGNVTQASKAIGVHRNTLHNKLRALGWESRRSAARIALQQRLMERRRGRR